MKYKLKIELFKTFFNKHKIRNMKMNFRSPPVYSMSSRYKSAQKKNPTPGVGTYDMDHKNLIHDRNPNYSIGKEQRMKLQSNLPDSVGPSTYPYANSTLSRRGSSIDKAKRSDDPTLVRRAVFAENMRGLGRRKKAQSGIGLMQNEDALINDINQEAQQAQAEQQQPSC